MTARMMATTSLDENPCCPARPPLRACLGHAVDEGCVEAGRAIGAGVSFGDVHRISRRAAQTPGVACTGAPASQSIEPDRYSATHAPSNT